MNVISLSIPCSSGSDKTYSPTSFPNENLVSSFLERSLIEKTDYSYGYDLFPVVVNQQKLVDFFGCFLSQKILSGIFHFLFYFILFLIHCIYTFSSLLFHLDPMGIYYSFWLTVLIGFLCVRIVGLFLVPCFGY